MHNNLIFYIYQAVVSILFLFWSKMEGVAEGTSTPLGRYRSSPLEKYIQNTLDIISSN